MFKRAHHYLTFLLVVTLILAAPMKTSEASVPAQGPPGYPDPPPEISSYNVFRYDPDPSRPYYNMEIYGTNGYRLFFTVFTEIINGEEITQNIQINLFEIAWPISVYFDLFPIECEQTTPPGCAQCILDEVSLCYERFLLQEGISLAAVTAALIACLRIKFKPLFVTCILAGAAAGIITLCLSVVEYQNCYRGIPVRCNARFPGCINGALWGLYLQTCLTWSRFPG